MRPVSQLIEEQNNKIRSLSCAAIIASLGVNLQRRGSHYVAMCPLHGDREGASLTVYTNTNSWCCFSPRCQGKNGRRNGGDGIGFIMQYKECSYPEAIDYLIENFNLISNSAVKAPLPPTPKIQIGQNDVAYFHSLLNLSNKREYFHNRGFDDNTIDREQFGFDGNAYIIPIWEGQPSASPVLSIKRRLINTESGIKYVRVGSFDAMLYGVWYCEQAETVHAFAGELDCALANQYRLPSFSLINGVLGWQKLPNDWAHKHFPNAKKLVVVFDRGEEIEAGAFASNWESQKGRFTSTIIHYPQHFKGKDFNEFILELGINEFLKLVSPDWA